MKFIIGLILVFTLSFISFKYVEINDTEGLKEQVKILNSQVELYKYFATIVPTKTKKSLFKAVKEKFSDIEKADILTLSGAQKEAK